jgi:hypothetical protein
MAVTSVDSAATSATLLAGGTKYNRIIIENTDANRLHVMLEARAASTTDYSFSLAQNENAILENYSGEIRGIWAADGSGAAKITTY